MTRSSFLRIAAGCAAAAPLRGAARGTVARWDVITVGNLSRNRYWGEPDDKGVRETLCTCTLISGDGFRLLVDPSVAAAAEMRKQLDRRTGLKPEAITAVFVTHEHADHLAGIEHFPKAQWLAAPAAAEAINRTAKLSRAVESAPRTLFDAIDAVPTPGHTPSHHALRFRCDGATVLVAGDSVVTRDFWQERRPLYNAIDAALAAKTMERMIGTADIIVPGHDNYFLASRV